jgi:hypothetical protein
LGDPSTCGTARNNDDFEKAGGHTSKCPGVVGNVAMWVAEMLDVEDNTRRSTSSESMT